MDYTQARSRIEDGDLIAVRGTHGILAAVTRAATDSPVTHVGIAFWQDGGLWMGELNGGGNHAVPLSQLSETDFDVYYPPVPSREHVRASLLDALRSKQPYGFIALPVIGLLNWLRLRVFIHWRKVLVCSGWSVKVYEGAGWPERSRILSPAELCNLLTLKLEVRRKPDSNTSSTNQAASSGFSLP